MKKIHSHSIILCCAMVGLVLPLVVMLNPTKNDNTRFKINLKEQPKNFENLKQKVNDTGNGFLDWIGGEQKQDEKSNQRLGKSNLQTSNSKAENDNDEQRTTIRTRSIGTNESGVSAASTIDRSANNREPNYRLFTNNTDKNGSYSETSKATIFCFNGNAGFINFRSDPIVDATSRDSLNRDRYTLDMAHCNDEIDVIEPAFINNGIRWYSAYYHGNFGYIAANAVKINR